MRVAATEDCGCPSAQAKIKEYVTSTHKGEFGGFKTKLFEDYESKLVANKAEVRPTRTRASLHTAFHLHLPASLLRVSLPVPSAPPQIVDAVFDVMWDKSFSIDKETGDKKPFAKHVVGAKK